MIRAAEPGEMDAVRELLREYAEWVGNPICFAAFTREMAGLPEPYSPLLVAFASGQLAGCAGLRRLDDDIGEAKRLYVRPAFRGAGLGRLLLERIIAEAKAREYRLLRLDTLPAMARAIDLYRAMGFREIPPYGDNSAGAMCFELTL